MPTEPRWSDAYEQRALGVTCSSSGPVLLSLPAFAAVVTLGGFLLATIMPMFAKIFLPKFGGTVFIWNVCHTFMQLTFLAGYLLALGIQAISLKWQLMLHGALLVATAGFLFLRPMSLDGIVPDEDSPYWSLTSAYASRFLMPSVAVAATTLVGLAWFAKSAHPAAKDPYFLFSAVMCGEIVGLLAYPFLIEPNLMLVYQAWLWAAGFVAMTILFAVGAALMWRFPARYRQADDENGPAIDKLGSSGKRAFSS